jgi:RecQ family ATP-dependent DNA helicase
VFDTLTLQIPAIAFSDKDAETGIRGPSDGGITIVVSPLIALMKDQVDALQKLGVYACAMDSTKSRNEFLQIQQDLREGRVKILYCAPERLNNEGFVNSLKYVRGGVRLVAVDEAHCVSEWGHSFRPDYLKVARFVREIQAERVICLTATATPSVAKDICKAFDIEESGMFRTTMYRPNLRLLIKPTSNVQEKYPLLFKFLKQNPGPTIIYATVQRQTIELANDLREQGFNAVHFHAGETVEYKTRIQDDFLGSNNMIICATIAFGMGIDKPDIRNVVHFDIPSSVEGYSQQVGRAGRDGKPSNCLFFVCPEDFYLRDVFVFGDLPSMESVQRFIDALCSPENVCKRPGETFDVSHYSQGRDFDIRVRPYPLPSTFIRLIQLNSSANRSRHPLRAVGATLQAHPCNDAEILQLSIRGQPKIFYPFRTRP